MSDVRTVKIKFKDLVFLEDNPRTIKKESLERLAKRIQDDPAFFEARPCLVNFTDGKYICYGGFQRGHAAAKILKWKEVPCSVENDVATDVMRRRAILDNTHDGEWDSDVLANQWSDFSIEELGELGVPDWVFGGDDDEGEIPNNALNSEAQEDDFDPPEIETVKTDIVLGDLFEIGSHRLLCGDSTKSEDVERLMGGEKADMVFTDPPYGIDYDDSRWDAIQKKHTGGNSRKFGKIDGDASPFDPSFLLYQFSYCKEIFVWGMQYYPQHLGRGGCIVWNRKTEAQKDVPYVDFELCWSKQERNKMAWIAWGGFKNKEKGGERVHPTQKPVALPAWFFERWGNTGDLVADIFLGSGTTMVAAHQLNRKCYGMELSEKYCQVIVDRMLKLDPSLEIKKNGQPYKSPNVADLA